MSPSLPYSNPLQFSPALGESLNGLDDILGGISEQDVASFSRSVAQSPPESSRRATASSSPDAPSPFDPNSPPPDFNHRRSPAAASDPGSFHLQHLADDAYSDHNATTVPDRRLSNGPGASYDVPQFTNLDYPATFPHASAPSGTWILGPDGATPFDPSIVMQTNHDPYSFASSSGQPMISLGGQQSLPLGDAIRSAVHQGFQPTPHQQQHHPSHPPLHISTAAIAGQHMGMMTSASPAFAPEFSFPPNPDLPNHASSSSSASSPSPKPSPANASTPTSYGPTPPYGHRLPHRSSRPSPTPESSTAREHAQPYPRPTGNRHPRNRPSTDGAHGVSLQQAYVAGQPEVSPLYTQRKQSFGHLPNAPRGTRRSKGHPGEQQPPLQTRSSYESKMGVLMPGMGPMQQQIAMQMQQRTSLDSGMGSPPAGPDYTISSSNSRTPSSDSSLAAWNSTEDLLGGSYDLVQYGEGYGSGGFSPTLETVRQDEPFQQPVPSSQVWIPPPAESIRR